MSEPAPPGAPAPATPAPTIAATLLLPQERIPRQPLTRWATEITARAGVLRREERHVHSLAGVLGGLGNMAALIAASRGDMDAAWSLTQRQLWWQGRLARRSRNAEVSAYALQPWVNLGRLEALTGRWREALARFSGLTTFSVAERLEFGCVQLTGTSWRALMPSRARFLAFLETVFVSDSLKALLMNRRFERVMPFVAEIGGGEGETHRMCEEACIVALCREGDAPGAAARARVAGAQARGWDRAVFRLRTAEAYGCAGDGAAAAAILEPLAAVVRQTSPERKNAPQLMAVTARLAGACHEAGLADAAHAVAGDVLQSARAAGDEPVEIEMLRLLASTAPAEDRPRWADAAHALEERTEYARYRRGGPPPANPVITELYTRLEEAFSS